MSDESPANNEPLVSACPITVEFLPDQMRKHVDPKAPVPLRMMAAKGLVSTAISITTHRLIPRARATRSRWCAIRASPAACRPSWSRRTRVPTG